MRDVEEALSRQVLYGGDLATNLLELASVSESQLTELLAENYGLERAPIGELPRADEQVRNRVPPDLALRHSFYPLAEMGQLLQIAVSEPLPAEVEQDLGFALGFTIAQRIAPLVRIRQALARDYRLPLDQRTVRLIAKLEGLPDPNPSSAPGARAGETNLQSLPRPPSLPATGPKPSAVLELTPLAPALDARTPVAAISTEHLSSAGPSKEPESHGSPVPSRRPRRLGPYTPAMAERDLLQAKNRDDVLHAFFDFSSQYFEYTVLFAIHGDIAEGRDASGPGAHRTRIVGIGIPLELPSALATARNTGTWQLARLSETGLDAALAKDLERPAGPAVLLLPVSVRNRCVLILYGDHGAHDVELSAVGELISLAPLVAAALERLILMRKRGEPGVRTSGFPEQLQDRILRRRTSRPSPEQRAAALASALDLSHTQRPHALPSAADSSPELMQALRAPRAPVLPRDSAPPVGPPPPAPPPEPLAPPLPGSSVVVRRITPVGIGSSHPPPAQPAAVAPVIEPVPEPLPPSQPAPFPLTRRGASREAEGLDLGWEEPVVERPGEAAFELVESSLEAVDIDSGMRPTRPLGTGVPHLELVAEEDAAPDWEEPEVTVEEPAEAAPVARRSEVPLAPASRSVVLPAHRPKPGHESSEELPSIIVDAAGDCRALVDRLLRGDELAVQELVEIGEPAANALAGEFPGPTTELRRGVGDGPSKASECGPVLRTLAKLGQIAVPFVVVRTADTNPEIRAWATRLLGEMPSEESARAVARRMTDSEPRVSQAARAAGRMLQSDANARAALRHELAETARDNTKPVSIRLAALEATEQVRDPHSIPDLVRLLDAERAISDRAHGALVVLTRQDFGRDKVEWMRWWDGSADKHRIEWLIDALMHDSSDIRREAGDELKNLTREYFGYYDDLPKKERARAQSRYREWWEAKGKARFR
ncbi:MAG TPA: hypothetical protein VGJ84_18180 [Polyangiaceae bacterium]